MRDGKILFSVLFLLQLEAYRSDNLLLRANWNFRSRRWEKRNRTRLCESVRVVSPQTPSSATITTTAARSRATFAGFAAAIGPKVALFATSPSAAVARINAEGLLPPPLQPTAPPPEIQQRRSSDSQEAPSFQMFSAKYRSFRRRCKRNRRPPAP